MSPRGGRRIGAGRPRTLENALKFAFWVDRGILEQAKKRAAEKGTNVSAFLRDALIRLAGGRRTKPRRKPGS
jgi:hypothetical protein